METSYFSLPTVQVISDLIRVYVCIFEAYVWAAR